ncbi:MAG: antitoxin [Candidatus Obscuribacterales bacterium]|nr:antitoxin [Candidatus Obscuribacterales bacterium]
MQTAKLFQNGKSQAVRLPKEFRLPGQEVYVKKMGNAIVLIPKENPWQNLIASLDMFSSDFKMKRDQPGAHEREDLFD